MEECAKDTNQNHIEIKQKKTGFFRRLKRGFTSIFQRKSNRKRNKSEPCLPGPNENTLKQDDEKRLSLNNDEKSNEKSDENGENQTSSASFRPVSKAPFFVNDFTAELKKSLLQRSKMVEEGQTPEGIIHIEMTRSNYSVSEEENQEEIERKTFEEKVALFESQISGGSVHNSLKRDSKLEENKLDIEGSELNDTTEKGLGNDNDVVIQKISLEFSESDNRKAIFQNFSSDNDGGTENISLEVLESESQVLDNPTCKNVDNDSNAQNISLEISELDKIVLDDSHKENTNDDDSHKEITNYELTEIDVAANQNLKLNTLDEETESIEKNFENLEIVCAESEETIEKCAIVSEMEIENNSENCQSKDVKSQELKSSFTENFGDSNLIVATDSVQLTNSLNHST